MSKSDLDLMTWWINLEEINRCSSNSRRIHLNIASFYSLPIDSRELLWDYLTTAKEVFLIGFVEFLTGLSNPVLKWGKLNCPYWDGERCYWLWGENMREGSVSSCETFNVDNYGIAESGSSLLVMLCVCLWLALYLSTIYNICNCNYQ